MGDYISKELCEEQAEYDVNHNLVIPLYKIRRMPAVDAVKHGRWADWAKPLN